MEISVNSYDLMAHSSSNYLMRLFDQGKSSTPALVSDCIEIWIIGEAAVALFRESETMKGAEHGQS